jgi:hypothetical protein
MRFTSAGRETSAAEKPAAPTSRGALELLCVARADEDTGAFIGQRLGAGLAKPPAGAGNKRLAACQTEIHREAFRHPRQACRLPFSWLPT